MAIRNLVKTGDPLLEKQSRLVEKFDERLWELLDDMKETMDLENGVGLAAPQVGIIRQVCIVDIGEGLIELINPKIIEEDGTQEDIEGCLSFPGEFGIVERPLKVKVTAQDRQGEHFEMEAEGFLARAFCHEIDHLGGVLFVTKASKMLTAEELEELRRQDEEEAEEGEAEE